MHFLDSYNLNVKNFVSNIQKNNKLSHAILIDGGTKEQRDSFCLFLAKFAVCSGDLKPCDVCKNCKKAEDFCHPDIKIVDGGNSNNSFHIDKIRDIIKEAFIKSNEADNKVFILNNCQNMTKNAQNALLKILEEPPKNIVFILECTLNFNLLETIRSRVQILTLNSDCISNIDNKAFEQAKLFTAALNTKNKANILKGTGIFIKDKVLFKQTLSFLELIFKDAILYKKNCAVSINYKSQAEVLAESFDEKSLLDAIDLIYDIQNFLDNNVNQSLLSTWFCMRLIKIFQGG